ncbi:MAG: zinc ribbon domain-containing protein [Candidatus Methanoperedens sp.]|nr:zinc ribbon domain-containing protein [Candidatus Methanoperedens sp.]
MSGISLKFRGWLWRVIKNFRRVHNCPFCGLVLDRDHNGAINILKRSISTVGTTGIQACLSNLNGEAMKEEAPARKGG